MDNETLARLSDSSLLAQELGLEFRQTLDEAEPPRDLLFGEFFFIKPLYGLLNGMVAIGRLHKAKVVKK